MIELSFFVAGILLGIIGVTLGGSALLSVPFFQSILPSANYGQVIGNIKVGSLFRGIASTYSTRKKLHFKKSLLLGVPFIIFSIIGALLIVNLDKKYLFFAILLAILTSELTPILAKKITKRMQLVTSCLAGIYAGFIGAGISLILVALLRIQRPEKKDIIAVKIEARFIETISTLFVVLTHIFYGNLLFPIWIYWSLGMFIGGFLGGKVLKNLINISPKTQHLYLYIVYLIALIPSLLSFLN